jgi:WhiB family redox-sensing transcriptional regulator
MSAFTLTRPADTRAHDRGADWRERAACLAEDPELFFPSPSDLAGITEAKQVCARCNVIEQCRETSLANREQNGVWGGLDEDERRRAIRRRGRLVT